jgi:hypothetical protein
MYRKRVSFAGIALFTLGMVGGVSQSAQAADYGVSVTTACQVAGYSSAYLVSSNVYGWRCSPGGGGANIQLGCNYQHPGTTAIYLNYSDPYSWRCRS